MTRAKYNIKYIPAKDLNLIQDKWRALQIGEEMTMFQSFEWYQMLLEHYIPDDTRNFESVFAVVESDGKPCMIAPLWIVKRTFRFINKKGVYLIGRNSFSDYLNFIYLHFNHDAFNFLLKELHKKYRVNAFILNSIRETTSMYQHISETYHIDKDSSAPCVNLSLPHSVENYHKMLSKNSRQNIRTANNRLIKDRKKLFFNFDDQQVDKDKCLEIRDAKLSVKYAQFSLIRKSPSV